MGVGSLVITVAPAIGPTVGGAVSSILPWRAIFVIVIPIILLVSLPVGLKCVEQHRPTEEARLNSLQFVSIVLALCGLVMFLNQAGVAVSAAVSGGSATVSAVFAVVSLIVGLGALLFFGWSSKRSFSPLIRLGWLRDPMVLLHLIAYMLLPIVGIGFGYVITNVAQLSLGTSAFLSGALVLPGALIGAFFRTGGRYVVRPFRTGASDSRRVFRRDLWADSAAGIFHATDTRHACRFSTSFSDLVISLGFSNIMTNALRNIAPQFMPDGNAVFNTCLAVRRRGRHRAVLHDSVGGSGWRRRRGGCHVPSRYGCRWQLDVRYHDWYRGHCHLLLDCGVPYWCET